MNIFNFFQLVSIISIDYPIALIIFIVSFLVIRKYLIKNYLIELLISFLIFIIFLIILYPILSNIGIYKDFVVYLNFNITRLFNFIATIVILHKYKN